MRRAFAALSLAGLAMTTLGVMAPTARASHSFSFTVGDVTVNEPAGTASVPVTVSPRPKCLHSGSSREIIQLNVTAGTVDGTATAPGDYTAIAPAPFPSGFHCARPTQFLNVAIVNDTIEEDIETFFVQLSNPTVKGCGPFAPTCTASIADSVGVVTIIDDDDDDERDEPDTFVTSGPGEGSQTRRRVTFAFSSPTAGATFECSLDGVDFMPCTSPFRLRRLARGLHTFAVRAVFEGGVDSTPERRSFTVR